MPVIEVARRGRLEQEVVVDEGHGRIGGTLPRRWAFWHNERPSRARRGRRDEKERCCEPSHRHRWHRRHRQSARARVRAHRLHDHRLHGHQRGRRPAVRGRARRDVRARPRGLWPRGPTSTSWTSAPCPTCASSSCELAAAHGKAVQVQKPIATTVEAAEEMIDVARRAGIVLGVVSQHRFDESSQFLHRAIRAGRLGRLFRWTPT